MFIKVIEGVIVICEKEEEDDRGKSEGVDIK